MERMEETNMRTVVIASLFCILLCLSSGLASAQFPTEKLEISAPDVATVGEEVTITVTADGTLVEGADVSANGIGIGKTDSNGQLKYTFTETGPVVLVAEKPGYLPAAEFTLRIEPVPTPTVPPTPTVTPSPTITIFPTPSPPLIITSPPVTLPIPALPTPSITDEIPPLVILKELHPKYFVVGDDEKYKAEALVIDNVGVKSALFLYRINGGEWREIETRFEEIPLSEIKSALGVELPKAKIPHLGLYISEIPSQTAGTFVEFKVRAEDVNGNAVESPIGMYFVTDDESETKVMVIDPSLKVWLCKENALHFKKQVEQCAKYEIPAGIWQKYEEIADTAERYENYVIQRHWWEMIAENYNIIIVDHEEMEDALKLFEPDVLIISNVWLDQWDLADHGMEKLMKYIRENHAGLIATHGSLFDEVAWTECKRARATEVGPRGQIGDKLEVYSPGGETVSISLGFPLMPLAEYVRDQAADEICEAAKEETDPRIKAALEATGRTVGSTPLSAPYVPFSGNLIVEERHPVVEGLPERFKIEVPSFYNEIGADAYTLVGWQYILPIDIRKVTQERAEIAKDKAEQFYEKISEYQSEVTGTSVPKERLLDGLDGKILNAITEANIDGQKVTVTLEGKEYTIQLDKRALEEITKRLPVKTIVLSDDFLGGILVYDEWFRPDGHRAVYFSFELEAAKDEKAKQLLINSIEWTKGFEFTALEDLEKLAKQTLEQSKDFRGLITEYPPPIEVSKSLPEIKPEEPVSVKIEKVDVSKIEIKVKNKVTNVNISIQKLPRKPVEIRAIPPGKTYSYFNISAENLEDKDIEKATIQFKVEKFWLDKNNIDVDTIKLNRYSESEGKWRALATVRVDEDGMYFYFEAESSGFSTFAITGEEKAAPPGGAKTPKPPGFEAVFAIASLLAVAYLVLRRKPQII